MHYSTKRYTSEIISLDIPFPVQYIQPNPLVHENQGKVAIRKGPLIYALDSADNDYNFEDVRVIPSTYVEEPFSIGGIEVARLHIPGMVRERRQTLEFIPYWCWGNRSHGDVLVWCKTQ